uniref:Aquaporin NIP7-1 n=1 Tax=Populus trichocarpa TaxID=3694 RepID=A0A2K1ZKK8_POPTR|eukprot:XP_002311835.3 probable aquaporin NIP7-1 [Populus trichocarpa]
MRAVFMKMKHLLEEITSAHVPKTAVLPPASSSSSSTDDQEMDSNSMPMKRHIFIKKSSFCSFLHGMDLNPARMVLAEMVGTFLLLFCVCGIVACTQILRGEVGLMEYASVAGLTIIVVIFSIGSISGAHVNPAVTIAFATFGHFPWSKVPLYILAQTVGSVSATYVGSSVYGVKTELMTTRPAIGCSSAFWVEFMATFMLMFLAASLTSQSRSIGPLSGFLYGIAIGLAVLITGPVSGGSLNPARSLGPAIVSWDFKDIWVYITAPTIGAVAGALMFHLLRIRPQACSANSSPDDDLLVHSIAFTES